MREIQRASPSPGEDWLASFLASLRGADLLPTTIRGYHADLKLFDRWFAEARGTPMVPQALTSLDVINYRQYLVDIQRRQPATVNRRLEAIRRLCRWAHEQGLATSNVAATVKSVRQNKRTRPAGLADPEVHAVLRAAGESKHGLARRNYALVQVLLQTGLRLGELASLQVADVVVRERVGLVRVRQGKGRKDREVPLNATGRRALRTYLESRGPLKPTDPLFAAKGGARLSLRALQDIVATLVRRAKVTRLSVSARALRHTFSLGYLKDNPGKLVELSQLLGHDSLDTTAIYTRTSQEALAQDLEKSHFNVDG